MTKKIIRALFGSFANLTNLLEQASLSDQTRPCWKSLRNLSLIKDSVSVGHSFQSLFIPAADDLHYRYGLRFEEHGHILVGVAVGFTHKLISD